MLTMMITRTIFSIATLLVICSCKSKHERSALSVSPEVVEARGYVVPKDSMAEPKVVPAGKPRGTRAGNPKVVPIYNNVHPAGTPTIVRAGTPRVCTPGQDS